MSGKRNKKIRKSIKEINKEFSLKEDRKYFKKRDDNSGTIYTNESRQIYQRVKKGLTNKS